MRYLSVCSGIEAATVAWHPLGWSAVAYSEIEPFPSAVLAQHYPHTPNWGDMTRFKDWPDADIDLLVGGTPCQSFSVAGLRKGLDDPRGSLLLTYLALARRYRPDWLVWENVPGVLSADDGRAFGSLLGGLAELGYGFAYRILDAQYFGLAQRRQRVFVVGHLGDWRRAAAVLFERESLSGHPAPRREAGQVVAGTIGGSSQSGGFRTTDLDNSGAFIPEIVPQAMSAKWSKGSSGPAGDEVANLIAHSLRADGFDASEDGTGRGTPLVAETAPTLGQRMRGQIDAMYDGALIAHTLGSHRAGSVTEDGTGRGCPLVPMEADGDSDYFPIAFSAKDSGADAGEVAPTLRAGGFTTSHANGGVMPAVAFQSSQSGIREVETHATLDANNGSRRHNGVHDGMQVRRLTPRECERLQGFPDDYTLIPYRGKPAADGPRYKALGNSMAVPVMAWIGRRIALVDALAKAGVA